MFISSFLVRSLWCALLRYCFPTEPPGEPGGAWLPLRGQGKTKMPCRGCPYTTRFRQIADAHAARGSAPKTGMTKHSVSRGRYKGKPLHRKGKNCIISSVRCGLWPLCRWVLHLRRLLGLLPPKSCRIFCFSLSL